MNMEQFPCFLIKSLRFAQEWDTCNCGQLWENSVQFNEGLKLAF